MQSYTNMLTQIIILISLYLWSLYLFEQYSTHTNYHHNRNIKCSTKSMLQLAYMAVHD